MIDTDGRLPLPWLEPALAQARRQRAHALLLHGPAGVGQFELALALAQSWLCEDDARAPHAMPCGRCAGCRAMLAHQHPDLFVLLPAAQRASLGWSTDDEGAAAEGPTASKTKPSREIRVDEVRQAIAWAQQTSSRGRGKVLLIHPASAMNAVAANALLKTLEEPPGRLRLLLGCADPEALLPTIRSRCQRIALALPPRDLALAWLAERGVADAPVLLDAAGGRPQDALALQQEGFDAARWRRVPQAVAEGDAAVFAGAAVARAVDTLLKVCHDLMLHAAGAGARYFPPASLPAGATLPALAAWAKTLVRTARHDEHPWNAPLLFEALVAEGRRCFAGAPPGGGRTATLGRR